jgi:hypothetical protein
MPPGITPFLLPFAPTLGKIGDVLTAALREKVIAGVVAAQDQP